MSIEQVRESANAALAHLKAVPKLRPDDTFPDARSAWRKTAKELIDNMVTAAKDADEALAVPVELVSPRFTNDHPGEMLFEDAVVYQQLADTRAALLTSFARP